MKSTLATLPVVATLLVWLLPGMALADGVSGRPGAVVTLEAPLAIPVSTPLRDRFGLGMMPALTAAMPLGKWTLLGMRLRCGFLSNGPAPSNPALRDPGTGGLMALSAVARLRPFSGHFPNSLTRGPWVELGFGLGLTGDRTRAVGEAALGRNFRWLGMTFGPSLRYLRVVQPKSDLDGKDAQMLLLGLELTLYDGHALSQAEADALAQSASNKAKLSDRDGDGIPDDLDKCPDEAEDMDGFEDEDGCPDLDNDKDGIPDTKDACPNEPETVNGFEDEDGCPDEAAIVVKENRIVLTERVLFETNQARVSPDSLPALAAVYTMWKQHPEWDHLVVDGYADRRGSDELNYQLSRQRCMQVTKMLIGMGFPADKLRIRAFGHRKLRVPGDTEDADRQNRRVEFVIVKKGEASGTEDTESSSTEAQSSEPGP